MPNPHDPLAHDEIEPEPEPDANPPRTPSAGKDLDPLPPDHGPEQHVITVRPSFWRGRPLSAVVLFAAPMVLPIAVGLFTAASWGLTLIITGVMLVPCWGTLGVWYVSITLSQSLRVTNKRIEARRGLISRSTNEVLHDHIRNIQVDQSVVDRIVGVGKIGISSAGQDEIEITMEDLPQPSRLAEILDRYRELG